MLATIHQPEHLPWLGFFHKIDAVDVFVVLDTAPYRKHYFQNRNRIRSDQGALWLTVPAQTKGALGQLMEDVAIDNQGNPRWRDKCLASLRQQYRNARFWSEHAAFFEQLYSQRWDRLVPLNVAIVHYLLAALGIKVDVVMASDLKLASQGADLLLDICRAVGADHYLSGVSGREYLDAAAFAAAGVDVRFQEFHHPIYRQLHEPFMPLMSVVDLLFTHGSRSLAMIRGVDVEVMDKVFE